MTTRSRGIGFLILCAVFAALTGGYAWFSASRRSQAVSDVSLPPVVASLELSTSPAGPQPFGVAARPEASAFPKIDLPTDSSRTSEPLFMLRHTGLDRSFGFLAVDSRHLSRGARHTTPLVCERVHFAAGHGVCLVVGRDFFTTYSAVLFDAAYRPLRTLSLNGIPSRVRVSRDGRRAAITVFVSGHSYSEGAFATETSIIDTETGEPVAANLEEFEVLRNGTPFRELDFNFWGVTFAADGNRFYATLGSGGSVYLVESDLAARRAVVLREDVECPSLSPDNTRVAFKKRMFADARRGWRLHVMDVRTLDDTPLAETRSIDDQAEWLDDSHILYELPQEPGSASMNVWTVPADGSGRPEIFLEHAASPVVVRTHLRGRSFTH
jgi:hypothetical protein